MTTGDPAPEHPHLPLGARRPDAPGQTRTSGTPGPAADPVRDPVPDAVPDPAAGSDAWPESEPVANTGEAAEDRPSPTTTSAEGITADLWAFRFADPVMAQEALLAAMRLQRRNRLQLDDAAIVVRDERGRTRIIQTKDISTGQGAISGSWLGLLAGMFVPGPGALVGLALGAAAGGLFAKLRDKGINDDEMKQWGEQLGDGESALFLLVEDCHQMRALHEVSRFPATVLTATADPELVERVRERLAVDPWGP